MYKKQRLNKLEREHEKVLKGQNSLVVIYDDEKGGEAALDEKTKQRIEEVTKAGGVILYLPDNHRD